MCNTKTGLIDHENARMSILMSQWGGKDPRILICKSERHIGLSLFIFVIWMFLLLMTCFSMEQLICQVTTSPI